MMQPRLNYIEAMPRAARWPQPGDDFNPIMFAIAREAASLTQSELADRINVSQATIGKWDAGIAKPSSDQAINAAVELGVHPTFFYINRPNRLASMADFYHRALTRANRKTIKTIHARCSIIDLQIDRLLEMGDQPEDRIPDINPDNHAGNAERIALMARTAMGVDRGPVSNLVEAIERCGGIVIDMDFETDEVDAICRWVPRMPKLFFINGKKPADRVRFSLAHELGHTIMHFGRDFENKLAEDQANKFAAAFLMPPHEIRRDFKPFMSLADLAALKRKWRVSMQALIQCAHNIGAIDDIRKQSLYVQMSRKGWRKTEPVSIEGETPRRLRDMLNAHVSAGYSRSELAQYLFVGDEQINRLLVDANAPSWKDEGVRLRLAR